MRCRAGPSPGSTIAGGGGGNGNQAGSGGNGANGGAAQGGAIYNLGKVSYLNTSFKQDGLTAGLGAQAIGVCRGNESIPCVGTGGNGGNPGTGGVGTDNNSASNGQDGPDGSDGHGGQNGAAQGKDVYGAGATKLPQRPRP